MKPKAAPSTKAPRKFDAGKDAFGKAHRVKGGAKQVVRHIVSNEHLARNGCDPAIYARVAHKNYQMGSVKQNNSMDKLVDNGVTGSVYGKFKAHARGYNAAHVARAGVPVDRQLALLQQKSATARGMFAASKDHATYKAVAHDYHVAAQQAVLSTWNK